MPLSKIRSQSINLADTFAFTGSVSGAGGGITVATSYRISANFANSADPITSNWEEVDTDGYGRIGTAVSQSSGIFTMPSTGVYLILANFSLDENGGGADTSMHLYINTTTDGTNFAVASEGRASYASSNARQGADCAFIFDVTNTSTHKVSFSVDGIITNNQTQGSSTQNTSAVHFIRLGDT